VGKHDEQIQAIFLYMKNMFDRARNMRKSGFRQKGRENALLLN
jgi:hypothetical protein